MRVDRLESESLHPAHTVLVVVPDDELRRSIAFAFEAEGLCIEPHESLPAAIAATSRSDVACLIVDENALVQRNGSSMQLEHAFKPLIVLVDRLRSLPASEGIAVLTKPLLGRLLVDTVAGFLRPPRVPPVLRSFP